MDSSKTTFSPSTKSPEREINEHWVSVIFSAYTPIASDVSPTNFSPIKQSVIFAAGPVNEANVDLGADASDVSTDSNTPRISIISPQFNEISLSWTLLPYG